MRIKKKKKNSELNQPTTRSANYTSKLAFVNFGRTLMTAQGIMKKQIIPFPFYLFLTQSFIPYNYILSYNIHRTSLQIRPSSLMSTSIYSCLRLPSLASQLAGPFAQRQMWIAKGEVNRSHSSFASYIEGAMTGPGQCA